MNFYLIDLTHPEVKLRHYRNSRVADYTCGVLNTQDPGRYQIISDNEPIVAITVNRKFVVDHLAQR